MNSSTSHLRVLGLFSFSSNGNLIFVFGLMTFVVFSPRLFTAAAAVAPSFRQVHRGFAVTLLLIASAHWWPFAIFLAPAIACAAASHALDSSRRRQGDIDRVQEHAPLVLVAAIVGTLTGIAVMWRARQAWMLAHLSAYYTLPSASFPPAAVALGFVLARCAATFALKLTGKWCSNEQASKCTDGDWERRARLPL